MLAPGMSIILLSYPCALFLLKGVIRVHVRLDPSNDFVLGRGWLPDGWVSEEHVSMYLGALHVYKSKM